MLKRLAILAALAAAPALVPNAQAQNAPTNGVLQIYGDDKCPTNDNGEEIVICQRLDEVERFRIPKNLREQTGRAQANESWAVRSQGALDAGRVGAGSCSAVGVGGSTGCFVQQATAAKRERQAAKKAEENLPLP